MTNSNKRKQQKGIIQDKDVFLYKLYNITSEHKQFKTSEPIFVYYYIIKLSEVMVNKTNNIRRKSL